MENTLIIVQIVSSVFCILTPIVTVATFFKSTNKSNADDLKKKIAEAREEGARNANLLNAINTLTEKVDRLVDNQVTKDEFMKLEQRVKELETNV